MLLCSLRTTVPLQRISQGAPSLITTGSASLISTAVFGIRTLSVRNSNSGAADIFRLPFEPYPAAGFAIADRNVNWETLGAIRNFRCLFRHWVEAHSVCETENLFRLPALLPPVNRLPDPRDPPTGGNTHLGSRPRLPGALHAMVQKARCQVKKNEPLRPGPPHIHPDASVTVLPPQTCSERPAVRFAAT